MLRLFKAKPFESEALDRLAETMKVTPILKRGKLERYYKAAPFARGCISYPDAILFDAKYFDMLSADEVLAVGAHEFNHIIKKHVPKRIIRLLLPATIIVALIGFLATINAALSNSATVLSNLDANNFSGLAIFFAFVFFACYYINAGWFRQQETECDLSSVEFANGEAMISALVKFRTRFPKSSFDTNLSKVLPRDTQLLTKKT